MSNCGDERKNNSIGINSCEKAQKTQKEPASLVYRLPRFENPGIDSGDEKSHGREAMMVLDSKAIG
jgi:hypothetical protein